MILFFIAADTTFLYQLQFVWHFGALTLQELLVLAIPTNYGAQGLLLGRLNISKNMPSLPLLHLAAKITNCFY